MSTELRYAHPVEQTEWTVNAEMATVLRWEYEDGRDSLLKLYDKGKKNQWDAAERIDWSLDLDPENPMEMPDEQISIYGSPVWDKMNAAERRTLRHHLQASELSQFMHGEQGALVCASKIVQQVPNMDSKFYAATQVIDEARHVEAYSRLLHDKFELAYPIDPVLKELLDQVISDSRWDFTYLGMQVLIEGLALAAFHNYRDNAANPLVAAVNAYVMQDEARHVAFGCLALRDYYPELSDAERDEREEFVVEACYLMRDRFDNHQVWETLGLPVEECKAYLDASDEMAEYRKNLFTRIVPIVKDIGLWGPRVRKAYADMGVLEYGDFDSAALLAEDDAIARSFDEGGFDPDARMAEAGVV